MIKTRTEAVAHLVSLGHHAGLCKAMVHAVFYMPPATDDLLRGWDFDSVEDSIIELTPSEVEHWWTNTMHEFNIVVDGIYLFGDLAYDLEGNFILS